MAVKTLLEKKNLNNPDETRNLPKTRVEVCELGGQTLMRVTFQPGWKWSTHVKPTAGTDLCEVEHVGYVISGRCQTVLRDGTKIIMEAGDFMTIPPGHDAWVLGEEPFVALDFAGGRHYAK